VAKLSWDNANRVSPHETRLSVMWFAWAIMILWNLLIAVQGVVWFRWIDRLPLAELPLRFDAGARRMALWGTLAIAALFAVYVGLTQVAGVTAWRWNAGAVPAMVLLVALVTALAGFGEEFLFRGYLLQTLSHFGPRTAAVVSSIIFAAIHAVTGRFSPLDQLALFLHGYTFALLTLRFRSIWPGLIIHFMYNGLTCLVWMGSGEASLLAFEGSLGWTKWAFKGLMVVPLLLLARRVGPRE